jgi:hypothetical protein
MKDESADAADRQCGQHFLGAASAKVHGRMNPGKGSKKGVPHIHIFSRIWILIPKTKAIVLIKPSQACKSAIGSYFCLLLPES